MIIKDYQFEKIISSNSTFSAYLIYGPNEGLVREKIKQIVSKKDDSEIIHISGKDIDGDPSLLDQSINTFSMFNSHKVIVLNNFKDKHINQIESLNFEMISNTTLLVQESILPKSSKLRKFFESHKIFHSIACYDDDIKINMQTIENFSKTNSIKLNRDVKEYLVQVLGVDRMININELEKIVLFCNDKTEAPDLNDIKELLNDTSSNTFQIMNDAIMFGETSKSSKIIYKLISEGINPISIIRSLSVHLKRVKSVNIEIKKGKNFEDAIQKLRPPVFWKDKNNFRSHCMKWNLRRLDRVLSKLLDAEITCKTDSGAAKTVCEKIILEVAAEGKLFSKH